MFTMALLTVAIGVPLIPISGSGDMYVYANLGPYGDPICHDARSTDLLMYDILDGSDDEVVCIDGGTDATSFADTRVELREDGFTAMVDGWGEAVGLGINDAFSRHDIMASVELAAVEDLRIRVSWFYLAAGLGAVQIEIQRLGDIGGPNEPSPPIVSRSASSYIDPITDDGVDVLRMPAGRWRISYYTTHQAMDTKEGFSHSFARTTHMAWYVPLGDVDGDGVVNVTDLLLLLDAYGNCSDCLADLDGDGDVDVGDLLRLLEQWGAHSG